MMDIEPHKVLVCVSPGEDCSASLDLAAAEARRRGTGVHLALAVGPMWFGPTGGTDLRLVEGEWRRRGAELLAGCRRRLRDIAGPELAVSTEITHGPVTGALVGVSRNADLVVVQHHRMGRRHAVPTMSVTHGVAARAHAPVVAVPDAWRESSTFSGIVAVGVEDTARSLRVARSAFEQARGLGGVVWLVHGWSVSAGLGVDLLAGQVVLAQSAAIRERLQLDFAALGEEFDDVPHQVVVEHVRAADVLVQRSRQARRLVVGRHDPALPSGSHLGPVTRAVLDHAACPVVVVDPHDAPGPAEVRAAVGRVLDTDAPTP